MWAARDFFGSDLIVALIFDPRRRPRRQRCFRQTAALALAAKPKLPLDADALEGQRLHPPRVQAIRSGGSRGTNIRLLYRVTDDSGRSSEKVAVFSGNAC